MSSPGGYPLRAVLSAVLSSTQSPNWLSLSTSARATSGGVRGDDGDDMMLGWRSALSVPEGGGTTSLTGVTFHDPEDGQPGSGSLLLSVKLQLS